MFQKLAVFIAGIASCGLAMPVTEPITHSDGLGLNAHPCPSSIMSVVHAAKPVSLQMAKLARANTGNVRMFRTWFGNCPVSLVNSVYDQIIRTPPIDANFQCAVAGDPTCKVGTGAYTNYDRTGTKMTAICPGSILGKRGDNACDGDFAGFGYTGLLLHEMAHHMTALPNWPVLDGPLDMGNQSCYGAKCIRQSAARHTDCQNAHIGDAYMLFAIATNCSSSTPVPAPGAGYRRAAPAPGKQRSH